MWINCVSLSGVRLGNLYCDPLITSGAHKITGRQRWTPTPMQLQILERIFDQGIGTPSKQKIKEITSELSQHGQISETNVYNWFQNRRARSKRKQQSTPANNAESEVETEVESPNDKKTKPEEFQSQHILTSRAEDLCFQNPQTSSAMHSVDPRTSKPEPMLPAEGSSKFGGNFGQMSFYGNMLSNPSTCFSTNSSSLIYYVFWHTELFRSSSYDSMNLLEKEKVISYSLQTFYSMLIASHPSISLLIL